MMGRRIAAPAAALLVVVAALTALTLPAPASAGTVCVRLPTGQILNIPLGNLPAIGGLVVPCGGGGPGLIVPDKPAPAPAAPAPAPQAAPQPGTGQAQPDAGKKDAAGDRKRARKHNPTSPDPRPEGEGRSGHRNRPRGNSLRNADGSPTAGNPGFVDALPGPSVATGVPNFVIRKFRVPVFLLPIYQAAGIQYGVRWEVLAAINEIETDYGRNLNVSSAGALGWMQFIPSTWKQYGVDANKDGKKDPYNPVDAIFAAARYLKAAGYEKNVRQSIFAYNHADWYVDSVMLRARLIAGVPADLVGSLTGLTEGRFPIAARARYADDVQEAATSKLAKRGQNAANVIASNDNRRQLGIYSATGAPVIATNDGQIKKVGSSPALGHYIVLQDVYGNRYRYSHLGTVAKYYPVPKEDANAATSAKALKANGADPKPTKAASAGSQPEKESAQGSRRSAPAPAAAASIPVKERLFAHPDIAGAKESGGLEQLLDSKLNKAGGFETYRNYFSRPFGVDSKNVRLRRLKAGSKVIGGTILGRVGKAEGGKASHINFEIRPAGRGAPRIDPKPILDGWKLLEATAIYRASGKNVLYGDKTDGFSIGQIILLPKPLLEKRVLSDERIDIYPGGREDIASGQIDRRVLATLEYLAESGLRPTVSCLKSGHSLLTTSGNISEHSSGNAVDISKINGVPIVGHQEPGGVTDTAVRRLMRLQGTLRPHQIISLLDYGQNTLALGDHDDHIHVGFHPLFGDNKKLGAQALAILKPGQWSDLIDRLGKIENPVVPTSPSKYALPVKKAKRGSTAHQGE